MWLMIHFSHFESIEVGSLLELKQCIHWEKKRLSPLGVPKRSKTPSTHYWSIYHTNTMQFWAIQAFLEAKTWLIHTQFSSSDGLIVPDLDIYPSLRARRLLRV